ncbi:MAG: hypothetical protein JNM93_09140 [Bacteriovoracaceae bacterium]|nr:hypothetical protein [Bacteriovoracaceae bacterium]
MKIINLLLILLLASCSTLKKGLIAGASIGLVAGAAGGSIYSPDEASRDKNAYLFGVIGAIAGAGLAYYLQDDEKKKSNVPMLLDEPAQTHQELPLFDFSPELKSVKPEVSFKPVKRYEVPQERLPKELEGKVKKQFIIEYEAEARTIDLGNRTIQISPFKAWEHSYEK